MHELQSATAYGGKCWGGGGGSRTRDSMLLHSARIGHAIQLAEQGASQAQIQKCWKMEIGFLVFLYSLYTYKQERRELL